MVEEVIRVVGGRRSLRMRRGLRSLRRISRRKRCWEDRVLWDMSMGGMLLRIISNRRSSIRDSSSSSSNNSNNNNNRTDLMEMDMEVVVVDREGCMIVCRSRCRMGDINRG